MRISVKDALSRYTPAVPEEFYKVSYSIDCVHFFVHCVCGDPVSNTRRIAT